MTNVSDSKHMAAYYVPAPNFDKFLTNVTRIKQTCTPASLARIRVVPVIPSTLPSISNPVLITAFGRSSYFLSPLGSTKQANLSMSASLETPWRSTSWMVRLPLASSIIQMERTRRPVIPMLDWVFKHRSVVYAMLHWADLVKVVRGMMVDFGKAFFCFEVRIEIMHLRICNTSIGNEIYVTL